MCVPCEECFLSPSKLSFYVSALNLSLHFIFVIGLNMYHSNYFFQENYCRTAIH